MYFSAKHTAITDSTPSSEHFTDIIGVSACCFLSLLSLPLGTYSLFPKSIYTTCAVCVSVVSMQSMILALYQLSSSVNCAQHNRPTLMFSTIPSVSSEFCNISINTVSSEATNNKLPNLISTLLETNFGIDCHTWKYSLSLCCSSSTWVALSLRCTKKFPTLSMCDTYTPTVELKEKHVTANL